MNERYLKWYSPWLSLEFVMLVFANADGVPLIIFPTSFGRLSRANSRMERLREPRLKGLPFGCSQGFLDYASLRSE